MPNQYVNKVVYGGSPLIDLSDTTATAADVAQGVYFYLASGERVQGTATGGGGSGGVTQDSNGFIVLPETGGGGGSTGLVYESGTWTPSEDVSSYEIQFTDTHTTAPFYYAISDETGTYSDEAQSAYMVCYFNHHQLFGQPFYDSDSGAFTYGIVATRYRGTGTTSLVGSQTAITYPYTDTGSGVAVYSRYWATETGIRASVNSSSRYFRDDRTYKWVAIWTPES